MPKRLPPGAYTASNNSGAAELFLKRKIYKAYAFYDSKNLKAGILPVPFRDFWREEDFLYGRIDRSGMPVQVNPDIMVEIEDGVKVVNFVAAAYRQLKKEFTIAAQDGRFRYPAPPFTDFKAVKGYLDPRLTYTRVLPMVQAAFITTLNNDPDVRSLKDLIPPFLQYLETMSEDFPITLSSFLTGPACSIRNSGLVLEIADGLHDSDEEKITDFILNPAFEFYKNAAIKYGFYIDMNAPWRLVANLASPAMQKFMGLFTGGSVGVTKYFEVYTAPAYLSDISLLQNLTVQTYNQLANLRPRAQKKIQTRKGVRVTTFTRNPADIKELNKEFPYVHWLKFYIHLKDKEKGTALSPARLNHIFNNSKNLAKSLDRSQAVCYINRNFDDVRSVNGSYNYGLYKTFFENMDKSQWPFTDFQEYFRHVVSLGTYKRY